MKNKVLSKLPYKGTTDWYPEDMYIRNYIFDVWSKVAKKYGYEEYDAPLIEDANLYRAKSGDEIANNQLFNFTDKGGREVALRPELTPSLARMIAAKKNELRLPIRWFNIGRFYRYEKPQKGRTREFFQLNIDIFGIESLSAEIEIIQFVIDVMKEFNAPENTYELKINSRDLLEYFFNNILGIETSLKSKLARALDNYTKMSTKDFELYLKELGLNRTQLSKTLEYLNWDIQDLKSISNDSKGAKDLINLFDSLEKLSISNIKFSPYIVRGFAYYTGIVIEMFDIGEGKNPRALFGGGRYDNLLEIFKEKKLPAFGLGWGDITTLNYLKSYNLIPQYKNSIDVFVCLMDEKLLTQTNKLVSFLRENNLNVLTQIVPSKLSNQLKYANSKSIRWVLILGEDELKKEVVQLKDMTSRESFLIKKENIIEKINRNK